MIVCDLPMLKIPTHLYLTLTLHFARHTYVVVSLKDNEWGTSFWLEQCIEGKKTLNTPLIYDECIEYLIGLMVDKGEYLTLKKKSRNNGGYVFMDYRPSALLYHFTNLVIGTNIQLQTITRKRTLKV
jgi:hypothetical protein